MIYLKWGMRDPRVVYGNPNCRWGNPSYLLEPGDEGYVQLQPGQPGYQPPPEPTRPARRSLPPAEPLLSQPNTNPATSMNNTLLYDVSPLSGGQFTTRVVNREEVATAELVALTQAELAAMGTPLTAEQIAACGTALAKVKISQLAKGRPIRRAFDYETAEIDTGGRFPDQDFTATNETMHPTVRTRLAPKGQALLESLIVYERREVKSERSPTISRVYDGGMNECNCLTLGGPCRISGPGAFGPEPPYGSTTLGLFIQRTGGTAKRIAFSRWTDSDIYGSWPTELDGTGDATLKAVVKYDGNSQSSTFIYTTPLTVHTA